MTTVTDFRAALPDTPPFDIVDKFLLNAKSAHVSKENLERITSALAAEYGVMADGVATIATGSAHLGFSLVEKKRKNKPVLKRYREFSAASDIDIAVISSVIFEKIWLELSGFSHRQPLFPWKAERLGDYLVTGWLRPDHFPKNVRLRHCDQWWDVFHRLSASGDFQPHRVRGGLFYSREYLRDYLVRAVKQCIF